MAKLHDYYKDEVVKKLMTEFFNYFVFVVIMQFHHCTTP
ncbi:hypothetical protein PSY84_24185, partial [Shigella flexneri]|nr:hypothetical protein [Shigella flexneri]